MGHPLDQITAEEINKAADLCKSREGFDENTIFINISLVEPEKEFTRTYKYYFPEWLLPQHNIFNTDLRTPEIKDLQFAENQEILLKKPWMKNLDLKNHPQVSYRYIGTINL